MIIVMMMVMMVMTIDVLSPISTVFSHILDDGILSCYLFMNCTVLFKNCTYKVLYFSRTVRTKHEL